MYEAISPKVLYFKNFYKDTEKFLEAIESSPPWGPWNSRGGQNIFTYGVLKTFHTQEYKQIADINQKNSSKFIINAMKKINLVCGSEYLKHFQCSDNELSRLKKSILTDKIIIGVKKYFEGGTTLGPHPDADLQSSKDEISITFYPNDNYEGGELNFPDLGLTIKPEAGSVVIYPSKYLHESFPVPTGEKLVSNHVYIGLEKIWK